MARQKLLIEWCERAENRKSQTLVSSLTGRKHVKRGCKTSDLKVSRSHARARTSMSFGFKIAMEAVSPTQLW